MKFFSAVALAVAAAAALTSACASAPPKAGKADKAAAPIRHQPFRAVGRAVLTSPIVAAQFSAALLADRQQRLRVDLLLPTGASAAVFWLVDQRWLLLDPAASVAYNGSLAEANEMLASLPPLYQAPLALGLLALGGPRPFGQGRDQAPQNFAATTTNYASNQAAAIGAWRLEYFDYDAAGWPARWQVDDGQTTLEVVWQRNEPLNSAELRLLEPRVPASFVVRSWRSLPPAPAANPNP